MALINCPECQKEISDKVKACPHCGYPIHEDGASELQKVEIASVNIKETDKKKIKAIVISVFSIIVAVAIITTGVLYYIDVQKKATEKKAEEEYLSNVLLVMSSMYSGSITSEFVLSMTGNVWYNSIYEKSDAATDKFTMMDVIDSDTGKGYFWKDFNISLSKLSEDTEYINNLFIIKERQTEAANLMKALQSPPESLQRVYDKLMEQYSAYQNLTDFAINPSGNLESFIKGKTDKSEMFMTTYNALKVLLPSE